MNEKIYLAQATQVPNNGASNAADFQPITQNPQTAPTSLQPGTVPQTTGSQDILNSQNARISVPASSGEPRFSAVVPTASGVNGLLVFVMIGTAVLAGVLLWYARGRRSNAAMYTEDDNQLLVDEPTEHLNQAPEVVPKQERPVSAQRPKKRRKSKSKRKRK